MQARYLIKALATRKFISTTENYAKHVQNFISKQIVTVQDRSEFLEKIIPSMYISINHRRILYNNHKEILNNLGKGFADFLRTTTDGGLEIFYDLWGELIKLADYNTKHKLITNMDENLSKLVVSDPSSFVRIVGWTFEYILIKNADFKGIRNLLSKHACYAFKHSTGLTTSERSILLAYILLHNMEDEVPKNTLNDFYDSYAQVI